MQTVIRNESGTNFTILNNEGLRDIRLSLPAMGLLSYSISLPDDWVIYFEEVAKHTSSSEYAVRKAWGELEDYGYARTVRMTSDKGTVVQWHKEISDSKSFTRPDVDLPDVEKPDVGLPDVVNRKLLNTNNTKYLSNQITNGTKYNDQTSLTDRFENLWKMYPRKLGKKQSFESYKRVVKKGVTDDEIKQGIENYLKEIKIKGKTTQYIKQGSTWFRNEGWDDEYDFTPKRPTNGKRPRVIEHRPDEWDNIPNDDDIVPDFGI